MRGRSFKWFKYIKLRAIRTRPKNSGNKMEGKGIVKGVSRMDGWNFFMKNAAHNLLMVRRWGNGTKKFYALQEKKKERREKWGWKALTNRRRRLLLHVKRRAILAAKEEKRREGIWSLTRGDLSCNILENGAALERRSPHTKIISAWPTISSTCKKKKKSYNWQDTSPTLCAVAAIIRAINTCYTTKMEGGLYTIITVSSGIIRWRSLSNPIADRSETGVISSSIGSRGLLLDRLSPSFDGRPAEVMPIKGSRRKKERKKNRANR